MVVPSARVNLKLLDGRQYAEHKSDHLPEAMPLWNYARQYYDGAETIFASKPGLINVLYSWYFHTVESLLKAYLKAHGKKGWGPRN